MGTHPIFESDFDCLTEIGLMMPRLAPKRPKLDDNGEQMDVNDNNKKKYFTRSQAKQIAIEKYEVSMAKLMTSTASSGLKHETLFNKIIRLAAEREGRRRLRRNKSRYNHWREEDRNEPLRNNWPLRVQKFGQVCVQWRDAIMTSSTLFTATNEDQTRDKLEIVKK